MNGIQVTLFFDQLAWDLVGSCSPEAKHPKDNWGKKKTAEAGTFPSASAGRLNISADLL